MSVVRMGGGQSAGEIPKSQSTPVFYEQLDNIALGSEYLDAPRKCLETPFIYGVWSKHYPVTLAPAPRVGHFSCIDTSGSALYIGYGANPNIGEFYNDYWKLDLKTLKFTRLEIKNPLPPRNGSRAVFVDNKIIIFGGFASERYCSDLHYIDLDKMECFEIKTTGDEPSPRSTPVVSYDNRKIFIWSGFNGKYPKDLHILDCDTLTWRTVKQEVCGRTGASYVKIGRRLLVYGGSSEGMFEIDMENEIVRSVITHGFRPLPKIMNGGMVAVNDFLMFFGGRSSLESTHIYGLKLDTMMWFEFSLMPDGETVMLNDGFISDDGVFMRPSTHSFSIAYAKERRDVVAFLGDPIESMTLINVITLGEALSNFHLQNDLLDMLSFDNY